MSFYQLYINPDLHENPGEKAEILYENLYKLPFNEPVSLGDRSHLGQRHSKKSMDVVRKDFGIDFSRQLAEIETTGWQKPMSSGLGYHVVYVNEIIESQILPFEEVRDKVEFQWKEDNRQRFANLLISGLRKEYNIIIQDDE